MAMLATELAFPAVEMTGVVKHFRQSRRNVPMPWGRPPPAERVALDGIDLDVATGSITGVIGPNGSGKSTLIRVLATLTLPDTGRARVFGYDIVAEPLQVRRCINRVSVEAAFFKEMSPWENMLYAARLYGRGGHKTRSEVESILVRLGLPLDTLDRPMKQLSRGQQQKVAIARSFLTKPSLLLMDEPTTGLDPRAKREVQSILRLMREEQTATVLLSTHDMHEAETLCDDVVILDHGRMMARGSPRELRRRYALDGTEPSLEEVYIRLSGKTLESSETQEESE